MSDEEFDVCSDDEASERTRFGSELVAQNDFVSRVFVLDRNTKEAFLVDTGSALSLLPQNFQTNDCGIFESTLSAVNDTQIKTYGEVELDLDFDLDRNLTWIFLVADVHQPILGADFLHYHDLLVDIRRCRLIDSLTKKIIHGVNSSNNDDENIHSEVVSSSCRAASSQTPNKFSYDGWQTSDCFEFERDRLSVATQTLFESKFVPKNPPVVGNSVLFSSSFKSTREHSNGRCKFNKSEHNEGNKKPKNTEINTKYSETKESSKFIKHESIEDNDEIKKIDHINKPDKIKIKESNEVEIKEFSIFEESVRNKELNSKNRQDKDPYKIKETVRVKTEGITQFKEYHKLKEPVEIKVYERNIIEESRENVLKRKSKTSSSSDKHKELKVKKESRINELNVTRTSDDEENDYEEPFEVGDSEIKQKNEFEEVMPESLIVSDSHKDQNAQTPLLWAKDWKTHRCSEITINSHNNNVSTQTLFAVPFVGGKLKCSLIASVRAYETELQKQMKTMHSSYVTKITEPPAKNSRTESLNNIPPLMSVDPRIRSESVQPIIENRLPLPAFYHKDPIFNIDKTRTLPLFSSSRPCIASSEGPASKRPRISDVPSSDHNIPPLSGDTSFRQTSSCLDARSHIQASTRSIPRDSLQPHQSSSKDQSSYIIQPSYVPRPTNSKPNATVQLSLPHSSVHHSNPSLPGGHPPPVESRPVRYQSFDIREFYALYENKKWFDCITPVKWLKHWIVHDCRETDVYANNEVATQTTFSPLTPYEYKIVQEERDRHYMAKAQARKELIRQQLEAGVPVFDSTTSIKIERNKKKSTIKPTVPKPPKLPQPETVFSEFECFEFPNADLSSDEDNLVIDERNSERLQTPKRWLHKGWVQWNCEEYYVINSTTKSTQTLFRKPMNKQEMVKLY